MTTSTPSLRDTIEQAAAHHANDSPYGTPPQNLNILKRPPKGDTASLSPQQLALLSSNFSGNLRAAMALGHLSDEQLHDMAMDLRQFRRAEENARALPGEYMGRDDLPHRPMPFAVRETHRPDRLPGTPQHAAMRAALDDVDREHGIEQLRHQMREHAGTDEREREEDRLYELETSAPSLRESLEAAAAVVAPNPEEN